MVESSAPAQERIDEFVVAAHHDFEKVQTLLAEERALLNQSARWRETPIQAAAHVGNRQIAEFLLEQGAPLDICTAAVLGRRDTVAALLAEDPTLTQAKGAHGIPLLYFAIIADQREIAEILLQAGVDLDAGAGGNTALHGAATFGRIELAEWLLKQGANPQARDFNGKTALDIAQERGHDAIVELLKTHESTSSS